MRVKIRHLAILAAGGMGLVILGLVVLHFLLVRGSPTPVQSRAEAMDATLQELREECRRHADGDWDRWVDQLQPYRTELKERIDSAGSGDTEAWSFGKRIKILGGKGDFPLFVPVPEMYLHYVVEPASVENFREGKSVVAAAHWLKRRGIDLIFVPVPMMPEVYPEHFAGHCPEDKVVAPQVRRLLADLVAADVEVIDLLPLFLEERDKDPEPLYQAADHHWWRRGQALAARAIVQRLKRYDFVTRPLEGPGVFQTPLDTYQRVEQGSAFAALTPEQRRSAERVNPWRQPAIIQHNFRTIDPLLRWFFNPASLLGSIGWGGPSPDPAHSPVLFIGDSFNWGLTPRVSRGLSLPVGEGHGPGQTTEAFKGFLRDPELLKDCKVMVWVVCNTQLTLSSWPLPRPIRESLPK